MIVPEWTIYNCPQVGNDVSWDAHKPTRSAREAVEVYERYITPAENQKKDARKEAARARAEKNWEIAKSEGRAIVDGLLA